MASFSIADVFAEIDKQAPQFGVSARNAKLLAAAENTSDGSLAKKTSFSGDAISPMGASGVMQVMPATARGLQAAGFLIWLCYPRLELDPMHAVVHDSKLLQTIVDVASRSSEALSNGKVSDLKLAQVLVCFHCMRALSLFHSHNAILSIL